MCFRTRQTLRREENKAMKSFECSFRNLNFSPSTSILLNFFFSFIDITYFFSQVKNFSTLEQSLNAKEAEAFKETSFSKARMVMRFPPKKNAGCPKAPRDFPPRIDGILYPRRVVLGLPSPSHRVCADGRTYGRSRDYYVRTKISWIDSLPNFLSNGAPLAGFACRLCYQNFDLKIGELQTNLDM